MIYVSQSWTVDSGEGDASAVVRKAAEALRKSLIRVVQG